MTDYETTFSFGEAMGNRKMILLGFAVLLVLFIFIQIFSSHKVTPNAFHFDSKITNNHNALTPTAQHKPQTISPKIDQPIADQPGGNPSSSIVLEYTDAASMKSSLLEKGFSEADIDAALQKMQQGALEVTIKSIPSGLSARLKRLSS